MSSTVIARLRLRRWQVLSSWGWVVALTAAVVAAEEIPSPPVSPFGGGVSPLGAPVPAEELSVSTDFPGGSAQVRRIDPERAEIEISPAVHPDRGWPCWWYFRVDGAEAGQQMKVIVVPSEQPFREAQRLPAAWALPQRAAVSDDDQNWLHTELGDVNEFRGVYTFPAPAERFWIAWGPPFLPAHAEALLSRAQEQLSEAERFVLAETRGGRPVLGLRIGGGDKPQAIWVQARQHAWETGGSWVGQGFLEWIVSDAPSAVALRERTEITFLPIMDVDNVTEGAGGKEAVPRDHNRDWSDAPVYPEVAAAQRELLARIEAGRLRVYLDLHNPGPGDQQPFFFGPFGYEQLSPPQRRAYDRFLELAIAHIRDPLPILPQYRFATYVKTEEERGRMSAEWVRRRGGEGIVAMTLETAWNTPHSTQTGYQEVGRGLAETVAAFLAD